MYACADCTVVVVFDDDDDEAPLDQSRKLQLQYYYT